MASTAPESLAAAESDAAQLLAEMPLPSDAVASSTEPAGDGGYLHGPWVGPPASPNAVDDHAWWIIPAPPPEVRAYINAHLHLGSGSVRWAAARTTEGVTLFETVDLTQLEAIGEPGPGSMALSIVQLPNGSTALRADAQEVWVVLRSASETIPDGARILRVEVRSGISRNQPKQRPLTIRSRKRIARIIALLNALPLKQPGIVHCPESFGVTLRLGLYARRGAPPLASAWDEVDGCGIVNLTIGGASQPPLEGGNSLISGIERALGTKLNTTPPWLRLPEHSDTH